MESKLIGDLDKQSLEDHVINIVKAGVNAIPVAGGVVGSLMSDYIPKQKEKRIIECVKFLENKIKELENNIDKKYFYSDEFAYIFEKTVKGISSNYQDYKIHCYKGILTNSLIKTDVPQYEKEYYLYFLDSLTELHIKMLGFLNEPNEYFNFYKLDESKIAQQSFKEVILFAFDDIPYEVLRNVFSDLYRMGFTNTEASIFGTVTAGSGFEIVKGRLTPLASKFIDFCTNY